MAETMQTPAVALTVDLEEWHHGLNRPAGREQVVADTGWLLDRFAQHDVHATFFVLGEVAATHPELVRRIMEAGHEIGFHGATHRFLAEVGPQAFAKDLEHWKPRLEELTGQSVRGFRAPFFSITPTTAWALPLLAEHGFAYDASIYPGRNDRNGWPGAPTTPVHVVSLNLLLFPVPLLHRWIPVGFSGGAYLRILPWPIVRWGLHQQQTAGRPGMIYVHPWEVSESLPRVRAKSLRGELKRHTGLTQMRGRVTALLTAEAARLSTMGAVLASMPNAPPWEPGDSPRSAPEP